VHNNKKSYQANCILFFQYYLCLLYEFNTKCEFQFEHNVMVLHFVIYKSYIHFCFFNITIDPAPTWTVEESRDYWSSVEFPPALLQENMGGYLFLRDLLNGKHSMHTIIGSHSQRLEQYQQFIRLYNSLNIGEKIHGGGQLAKLAYKIQRFVPGIHQLTVEADRCLVKKMISCEGGVISVDPTLANVHAEPPIPGTITTGLAGDDIAPPPMAVVEKQVLPAPVELDIENAETPGTVEKKVAPTLTVEKEVAPARTTGTVEVASIPPVAFDQEAAETPGTVEVEVPPAPTVQFEQEPAETPGTVDLEVPSAPPVQLHQETVITPTPVEVEVPPPPLAQFADQEAVMTSGTVDVEVAPAPPVEFDKDTANTPGTVEVDRPPGPPVELDNEAPKTSDNVEVEVAPAPPVEFDKETANNPGTVEVDIPPGPPVDVDQEAAKTSGNVEVDILPAPPVELDQEAAQTPGRDEQNKRKKVQRRQQIAKGIIQNMTHVHVQIDDKLSDDNSSYNPSVHNPEWDNLNLKDFDTMVDKEWLSSDEKEDESPIAKEKQSKVHHEEVCE
jgi:hypothetical protein